MTVGATEEGTKVEGIEEIGAREFVGTVVGVEEGL